MAEVSIRELRNHGGEIVDRAAAGEAITITRAGRAVASLAPVPSVPLTAETLLQRWRLLPSLDPVAFRDDLDSVLDSSL